MSKVIAKYQVTLHGLNKIDIELVKGEDLVTVYKVIKKEITPTTELLLLDVKSKLLKEAKVGLHELFEAAAIQKLHENFTQKADKFVTELLPTVKKEDKNTLVCNLLCDMLGLGDLEIPLADQNLEEVVVNTSKEPVWVYHKEFGWLKTNIIIGSEKDIQNYASIIARRIGRQITTLTPLLDAHLTTGDRANATLFPVSTKGNTITIRKFRRKPWTITDFIKNQTISLEVAAFLWLAIQYELNMILAGGTSSGKTALLNTLMPFIQPNHRIISIEDTRELQLPDFLHWVPLTTREPNPEGKGEVSMLDLMINSLRMRPDRIVVGEIRRADQAEVLFEAMHTGHSVYATLHADTADQVVRRMTNPPINIPDVMMEALHLIAVQHRDRRLGIRRTYQVAELLPVGESGAQTSTKINILYRMRPDGTVVAHDPSVRVFDTLRMHTGMTDKEMLKDIEEKMYVLEYMMKKNIDDVNVVGKTIAEYYFDKDNFLKKVKKNL